MPGTGKAKDLVFGLRAGSGDEGSFLIIQEAGFFASLKNDTRKSFSAA